MKEIQLTRDYNKGISSISYDQFGNPFKVTFGNKSSIEYVYSADGIKLKARHITAIPQDGTGSSSSSTNYIMSKDSTDYIGDFIYHNNRFSRYNWGNGYIVPAGSSSGYAYRFYIRDHQGNNRLVTTSTGTVKQTTHYYPDGVTHDKSTGQGEQVYKYNGKELDRMHGLDWYDYGAREYDPTTGMFTSMDPLCEKYYHISPYAYCAGNPVRYVDPDGRYLAMYDDNGIQWRYNVTSGCFENNGKAYKGTNDFIKEVTGYLNYLCKGEAGKTLVSDLVQRKEGISIVQDEMSGERERFSFRDDGIKSVVRFNPEQKVEGAKGGVVLGHELAHSQDRLNGTMLNDKWFDGQTKTVTISERYAMHWENLIRAEHGVVLRQYYADPDGRIYSNSKNDCVSLYFDSKYPNNVNYKNVLPEGIKGYVYKIY